MRIRDVTISGLRGFTTPRTVSFVDEATGGVRPVTVLAGSNGSGKTTILEVMFALPHLCAGALYPPLDSLRDGLCQSHMDWSMPTDAPVTVAAVARSDRPSGDFAALAWSPKLNSWSIVRHITPPAGEADGVVLFPHNRWIDHSQKGGIEPPPTGRPWLFRFDASAGWQGSLAQLWVWQNYLDLEQHAQGRPNLAPLVETVETLLGDGRQVVIREGRVRITGGGRLDVEPHELPSGEQQVLTLFGELQRHLRPGAVVLIDEIEISLHPALQRKVIGMLRALAAKYDLQIVVTTHSTEILRAVAPEEIVSLDDLG